MASNEKERVLQKHIFDNLWLLDPSWERGTENAKMEEIIQLVHEKELEEIKQGRIDIHYRQTANKHLIIELKRVSLCESWIKESGQWNCYIWFPNYGIYVNDLTPIPTE